MSKTNIDELIDFLENPGNFLNVTDGPVHNSRFDTVSIANGKVEKRSNPFSPDIVFLEKIDTRVEDNKNIFVDALKKEQEWAEKNKESDKNNIKLQPNKYDDWAKDKGTIYNKGDQTTVVGEKTLEESGQVADIPTAWEMAKIENIGRNNPEIKIEMDAAEDSLEKRKAQEAFLGGLTEEQKENQVFMELMKEKFPDAFTTFTDSKGRDIMMLNIFRGSSDQARPFGWKHSQLLEDVRFLTVYGAFELHESMDYDKGGFVKHMDWTKTLDLLSAYDDKNPSKANREINDETSFVYIHPSDILKGDYEVPFFSIELKRCDLGNEDQRKLFKDHINKSIEVKGYIDEFEKVKASKPAGADLANLF